MHEDNFVHLLAMREVVSLLFVQRKLLRHVDVLEQLKVLLEALAEQLLQQLLRGHRVLVWDAAGDLLLHWHGERPKGINARERVTVRPQRSRRK